MAPVEVSCARLDQRGRRSLPENDLSGGKDGIQLTPLIAVRETRGDFFRPSPTALPVSLFPTHAFYTRSPPIISADAVRSPRKPA